MTDAAKGEWQARADKQYMYVDEIYNSSNYIDFTMMAYSPVIDIENGYIDGVRIVDEANAVNVLQIPALGGRENYDVNFF